MQLIEAYTAGGVASGAVAQQRGLHDGFGDLPVVLEQATWYPIDGGPPERRPRIELDQDDVLLLTTEAPPFSVHAVWHAIVLDAGPYRITGELAMPPGFDPGRALTRPSGEFVELRDARIELAERAGSGMVERANVLVNRYTVERVAADLILGFFFPGATLVTPEGAPAA